MPHNTPSEANTLTRLALINHPSTFNCQVFRPGAISASAAPIEKPVPSNGHDGPDASGAHECGLTWVGNGYALMVDDFPDAPDNKQGDDPAPGKLFTFRFLIEPEEARGNIAYFEPQTGDFLYLLIGTDPKPAKLAFEIVGLEGKSSIPPFTQRYMAIRRDDLHEMGR